MLHEIAKVVKENKADIGFGLMVMEIELVLSMTKVMKYFQIK